jgi:hypothetical protein
MNKSTSTNVLSAALALVSVVAGGCASPPMDDADESADAVVVGPEGEQLTFERTTFDGSLKTALDDAEASSAYCAYRTFAVTRNAPSEGTLFIFGKPASVQECARVISKPTGKIGATAADALAEKADLSLTFRLMKDGNGATHFVYASPERRVGSFRYDGTLRELCTGAHESTCTLSRDKTGKFSISVTR